MCFIINLLFFPSSSCFFFLRHLILVICTGSYANGSSAKSASPTRTPSIIILVTIWLVGKGSSDPSTGQGLFVFFFVSFVKMRSYSWYVGFFSFACQWCYEANIVPFFYLILANICT